MMVKIMTVILLLDDWITLWYGQQSELKLDFFVKRTLSLGSGQITS